MRVRRTILTGGVLAAAPVACGDDHIGEGSGQ